MPYTPDAVADYLITNRRKLWFYAANVLGPSNHYMADDILDEITSEIFSEDLTQINNLPAFVNGMVKYTAMGRKKQLAFRKTGPLDCPFDDQSENRWYRDSSPNIEHRLVNFERSIANLEFLSRYLSKTAQRFWADYKAKDFSSKGEPHWVIIELSRMRREFAVLIYRQANKLRLAGPVTSAELQLVRELDRRTTNTRRHETNSHPAHHTSSHSTGIAVVSSGVSADDRSTTRRGVRVRQQSTGCAGTSGGMGHSKPERAHSTEGPGTDESVAA